MPLLPSVDGRRLLTTSWYAFSASFSRAQHRLRQALAQPKLSMPRAVSRAVAPVDDVRRGGAVGADAVAGEQADSGDRWRWVVSPRLSGDIHSSSQPVFGLTSGTTTVASPSIRTFRRRSSSSSSLGSPYTSNVERVMSSANPGNVGPATVMWYSIDAESG